MMSYEYEEEENKEAKTSLLTINRAICINMNPSLGGKKKKRRNWMNSVKDVVLPKHRQADVCTWYRDTDEGRRQAISDNPFKQDI